MKDRDIVIALERGYRWLLTTVRQRFIPWWHQSVLQSQVVAQSGWNGLSEQVRWFVLAYVATIAIQAWHLGTQNLWLDEGATWAEITQKSTGALALELLSKDAAYPLYHLLLNLWIAVAGDSEIALRLPSLLASAGACAMVSLAFARHPQRGFAWLMMSTAPVVIWYAQDAKVYAMWLLWSSVLTVVSHRSRWWWFFVLTLPFVHRLGLLMMLALFIIPGYRYRDWRRQVLWGAATLSGLVAIVGIALAIRAKAIGGIPWQSPFTSLFDLLARFLADRRWADSLWGVPVWVWVMPFLWLLVLGMYDAWQSVRSENDPQARQLLLVASVPGLVVLASYGMTPYFDARYAIMVLPAWIILMVRGTRYAIDRVVIRGKIYRYVRVGRMLLLLTVFANVANVFEPTRGIYSGAPVKEQWREVVTELAHRVTRDDLVVVHPAYAEPLYWYYARVTRDPLPKPVVFPHFSDGFRGVSPERTAEIEYQRRLFEAELNQAARGKQRAFLLIAPDHANQVDPPIDGVNPHGRVWLYFHYPQRSWPCGGIDRYGVSLMCQSYPSAYGTNVVPQPEKVINAVFGEQIKLRGVTVRPLGNGFRARGTVPIQLFWEATAVPRQDYRVFVHLCQRCNEPPLAQQDGPPLYGYGDAGRMTTWQLNDPVHDERSIVLPADLPAGKYAIIVGVYDMHGNRLKVISEKGGDTADGERLIVETVTVIE